MGGPGTRSPGQASFIRATLNDVLLRAYGLSDFREIVGPRWLATERYDFIVKIPPGTGKEEFKIMLQNLLQERFKVGLHREKRDLPVFELTVRSGGVNLKKSLEPSTQGPEAAAMRESGSHPPSDREGLDMKFRTNGMAQIIGKRQTLSALAAMLLEPAGRPVLDKTGLTDKYDFTLEFALEAKIGASTLTAEPIVDLFGALRHVGLQLQDTKAPYDVIVIDTAERTPVEN